MKELFWSVIVVVLLQGCAGKPYTITQRPEGAAAKVVFVDVPADSSTADIEAWGKEIDAAERPASKKFWINFYDGKGNEIENMIGTYEDDQFVRAH